jgi:glycosyltransferase involved in cell wall biosynthesis
MRVALVNSFFPPWRGGAETYAYSLAKALTARGHEVVVSCANEPLPPGTSRDDGIMIRRHRLIGRLYGTPIMPSLVNDVLTVDADIFHANFPSPYIAFIVALVSSLRGIPAVLTWHNDLPPVTSVANLLVQAHDHLVLPLYIRAYRRIIATSETYARQSRILNNLGQLVTVVPNGVDCERFNPNINGTELRTKLGLGNRFTLLFVGALTKWHRYKGLDVLLQAVKRVICDYPDLMLVIVGDGELRQFYYSMSQRLDVSSNTIFAGDVPDAELPGYYAAVDALVLPSKDMSEGFGLTLLEANATGKPVIASNVGGIPSVIKNGHNGILVPPNDPKALADGIAELRENLQRTREMGLTGRQFAELHDWTIVAARSEQVYLEALERNQ